MQDLAQLLQEVGKLNDCVQFLREEVELMELDAAVGQTEVFYDRVTNLASVLKTVLQLDEADMLYRKASTGSCLCGS